MGDMVSAREALAELKDSAMHDIWLNLSPRRAKALWEYVLFVEKVGGESMLANESVTSAKRTIVS